MSRGLPQTEFELVGRVSSYLERDELRSLDCVIERLRAGNSRLLQQINAQAGFKAMLVGLTRNLEKLNSGEVSAVNIPTKTDDRKDKGRSINAILKDSRDEIELELKSLQQHNTQRSVCGQHSASPNGFISSCDMNSHMKQFLTPLQPLISKKQELSNRLDKLVNKTRAVLKREEPYVQERIMLSVLKEMKAAGNLAVLQRIKQLSSALLNRQKQRSSTANGKQSVAYLVSILGQNVNLLKEVKERKVLNNDAIFEGCKKLETCEPMATSLTGLDDFKNKIKQLRHSSVKIVKKPAPATAEDYARELSAAIDCKLTELIQHIDKLADEKSYQFTVKDLKTTELQQAQTRIFKRLQVIRDKLSAARG